MVETVGTVETVPAAGRALPLPLPPPPPPVAVAGGWNPEFDVDDDLDGVLAARSPLLARAFRGEDRRR
jgi:hypothetical protein